MRGLVFAVALAFIAALAVLTAIDLARFGVTPLGVVGVLILVLFMIAIIGALRHPPNE